MAGTHSWYGHDYSGQHLLILLDFKGRIVIPLSTIPVNTDVSRWFPLHHTKKYHTNTIHGEIKLFIHLKVLAKRNYLTLHIFYKLTPQTMGVKKVEEKKPSAEEREEKEAKENSDGHHQEGPIGRESKTEEDS